MHKYTSTEETYQTRFKTSSPLPGYSIYSIPIKAMVRWRHNDQSYPHHLNVLVAHKGKV